MSMKETLKRIQRGVDSVQGELSKLDELIDNLEKTVGGVKPGKPVKPSLSVRKKAVKAKTKAASKGTATERVMGLIKKSPEGISTEDLIKQTGLQKKTVYGVLTKAKKQKKVKSPKRGTYVTN